MGFMACGRPPIHNFNPAFEEYTSRFEVLGGLEIGDMTIQFGSLQDKDPGTVGVCTTYDDDTIRDIVIDTKYWNNVTDLQREELMFHELGHCVLNREHRNDALADGCPASIMFWETVSLWCLNLHLDYYRNELFGRS